MFLSYSNLQCLEQLARDWGNRSIPQCGSERVGADERDSSWSFGDSFQIALSCHDCGAGTNDLDVSTEEARSCSSTPTRTYPTLQRAGARSRTLPSEEEGISQTPYASKREALRVWDEIDHPNLKENIEPTKDRARLILEKGPDHSAQGVRLRKI